MKILYAQAYPDEEFEYMRKSGRYLSQAAQKFNKLYIKGFCKNNCDVDVLLFNSDEDKILTETYYNRIVRFLMHKETGNFIKRRMSRKQFITHIIKEYKEQGGKVIVIDALTASSLFLSKVAHKNGLKVISVITDLLGDAFIGKGIIGRIKYYIYRNGFYKQFIYTDHFILLTEEMKEKISAKNMNYTVFNGICDCDTALYAEKNEKFDKRVLVYSGEIRKMYGIHNLVDAFIQLNASNSELWLYGPGIDNYPDLKEKIEKNPSVKYLGVRPNSEVTEVQKKATLLINPRLTYGYGDYIRYSFPSKNIEYMISGTPLVTTKLPAIKEEYNDYLYYFDDETVEGMAKRLKDILSLKDEDLAEKGKKAQEFIFNKLNNRIIAEKILSLITK